MRWRSIPLRSARILRAGEGILPSRSSVQGSSTTGQRRINAVAVQVRRRRMRRPARYKRALPNVYERIAIWTSCAMTHGNEAQSPAAVWTSPAGRSRGSRVTMVSQLLGRRCGRGKFRSTSSSAALAECRRRSRLARCCFTIWCCAYGNVGRCGGIGALADSTDSGSRQAASFHPHAARVQTAIGHVDGFLDPDGVRNVCCSRFDRAGASDIPAVRRRD